MTTTTFVDFYSILDLPDTASESDIKEAIQAQRRLWNKRQGLQDLEKRQEAEKRIHDLTEAERVLLNKERRSKFDQERKTARPQATPAASDSGGDWLARAKEFMRSGQLPSANFAAREAITTQGGSHEAWSIRAHSALSLGEWREAEFSYNEAIRIKPDEAEYHFDLGNAFEGMGDHVQALGKYEDALKIEPQNPVFRTSVASIFLKNGVTDRARPIMEEVVSEHPDIEAFQYYLAWALVDSYDDYATILNDGSFVLTSSAQVERMYKDMWRAQDLKFEDAQMRDWIQRRINAADEAAKDVWRHPSGVVLWFWIAVFLIGLGMIAAYGLGIVVLGLAIWGYFSLYKMPKWKANAKDLKYFSSRVKEWGLGGRP